jgi:hypothetical protein
VGIKGVAKSEIDASLPNVARMTLVVLVFSIVVATFGCSRAEKNFEQRFVESCMNLSQNARYSDGRPVDATTRASYCNCNENALVARYGEATLHAIHPSDAPEEMKQAAVSIMRSCAAKFGLPLHNES